MRNCVEASCKPRFGGPAGFQYPGAMWKLDGPRGPEIIFSYSARPTHNALFRRGLPCLLAAANLKFTGLTQNLGQPYGFYREF